MTTCIDHDIDSTTPAGTGGVPGVSLVPALWSLWSLPLTTFRIWTTGWASPTGAGDAIPAEAEKTAQLPVPAELGEPAPQEIFA